MRRTADDRARQMRTGSGAAVQRAFPYLDDGGGEQRINRRTANTSWQLGSFGGCVKHSKPQLFRSVQ